MSLNVRNSQKFSLEIEKLSKEKDLKYMETIILYCEQEGLDIETVGTLVNQSLKEKIALEAQELNYMPKTSALPFV